MLKISEFAPYFSKSSFDIKPDEKEFPKIKPNKKKEDYDYLFHIFFTNLKQIEMKDILNVYNERDEKIKIAEKLEQMKFKNKDEIVNNLIYEKRIKLSTLNIICKLMNANVIYIFDKIYVNMKYNETKPIVINYNCRLLDNFDLEKLNDMYEIILEKPIKAVSAYKLGELQEISKKLDISIEKKKKQELYDEIKSYLSKRNF